MHAASPASDQRRAGFEGGLAEDEAGLSLSASSELPPRASERRDIASAIRTFGKDLGRPLDELAAHPRILRERPAGLMPGLSNLDMTALKRFKRRWDNKLSLLLVALKHVGIIQTTVRRNEPFAPKWTALFRLVTDKYDRI